LTEVAGKESINFAVADVNKVLDIHAHYNVSTVPTLLEFESGELKNVIKGCQEKEFYSTIFKNAVVNVDGLDSKKSKQVIVYTTPTCTYCNAIKSYLSGNGIAYREIDVSRDENAAREMVRRSGQQGVPQTLIDGRIVVGYDKTKIDQLLEIN
jgi:glutaredoxin-like YruB-family protein